tara:strand:+ start:110 stop:2608 length:2499 start_codon:yes stop_codon:yes gene_type:complete
MDLKQSKLTKTEWENTEIPVGDDEKRILRLICDGFHDVSMKTNMNQSLYQLIKIQNSPEMEAYLYERYFSKDIKKLLKKYGSETIGEFKGIKKTTNKLKKADIYKIDNMDNNIMVKKDKIFEFVILDMITVILKSFTKGTTKYSLALYTLIQLLGSTIPSTNTIILELANQVIDYGNKRTSVLNTIHRAYEYIEKNPVLLKYEDLSLFEHQKRIYNSFKLKSSNNAKLVLYCAPTGTGKTLTPLGLSEGYKVIFICVSRHVGLALAKSAICMEKKVAFAFGCDSAEDIRLHYYAAKDYTKHRKSGGIGKVDNSVGDKVEIMICDVQSYLTAMYYMLAFNKEETIITYWDEPTITMDYEEHELHKKIHENWEKNKISKMVLSCATLPKENEIHDALVDFKCKFEGAEIISINSYDFKKSISLLNNNNMCVLPHLLYSDYFDMRRSVAHCLENKTLLRYFDLGEIIRFIKYINDNDLIDEDYKLEAHFTSLSEVTMINLKTYYLDALNQLEQDVWSKIHTYLKETQELKFPENSGKEVPEDKKSNGILLTTSDAHTLTDGPTIFLAKDVKKIGNYYIKYSNISKKVFNEITQRIEHNNKVTEELVKKQRILEDKTAENEDTGGGKHSALKQKTKSKDSGDKKAERREKEDPEIRELTREIEKLRKTIVSVKLPEVNIPNTKTHQEYWTREMSSKAFVSEIDEEIVCDIMELDVEDHKKVLLLMGIGMFDTHNNVKYAEIMKALAYSQRLYLIIASDDYIYGTNYSFCHGFIGKDLTHMTQQKIIQALGRIGRNKIQQEYTVRFRDNALIERLLNPVEYNLEAINMNRLFITDDE